MKLDSNLLSWIALISGMTAPILFNFLGQLYLGEVILTGFSIVLILGKLIPTPFTKKDIFSEPVFLGLLVALCVTLFGLILSDFWAGSPASNYIRGWARWLFLGLTMIALSSLGYRNKWNLWWYSIGLGSIGVVNLIGSLKSRELLVEAWKVQHSLPITLLVLSMTPWMSQRLTALSILVLGLVNVVLDFRSQGLFCVILAAIVWAKSRKYSKLEFSKLLVPLGLSILVLTSAYLSTQQLYGARRLDSNTGRFAAYQVAVEAILRTPVLGYGSWATNRELTNLYLDLAGGDRSFQSFGRLFASTTIPSHSQFLQAWVEGGILGVTFFTFLGYQMVTNLIYIIFKRPYDLLFPLFLFNLLNSSWNLFASPFGGSHRIYIASSVATVCVLSSEKLHRAANQTRHRIV
jgi:O-antigen ligase